MKKETKKFLIKLAIFISIFALIGLTNNSYALFKGIGPQDSGGTSDDIKAKISDLLGILEFIGIVIGVGMSIWLGVLYFTTSDNPANKAETSKKAQSIFLGIVLVLGASAILTLIRNLALNITEDLA